MVHEHVVTIHAVDTLPQGVPYLVMQYVAGKSVQELIDRGKAPELAEILRIGSQAADGLAAAHAQGLIHRDIKPANILLENGVERVKITDFGLARAVDDAEPASGVVAGTPQYMSPEQAGGEPIDHRTDLFSLGSVLYALCTGQVAVPRRDDAWRYSARVCEEPRPIETQPRGSRLAGGDRGDAARQGPGRAIPVGRRGRRAAGPAARRAATAGPTPVAPPGREARLRRRGLGDPREDQGSIPHAEGRRGRHARRSAALLLCWPSSSRPVSRDHAGLTSPFHPRDGRDQSVSVIVTDHDQDGHSTIVGSGKAATRRFELTGFTGVEIANTFHATITQADRFAVSVTADDNVLAHVLVDKEGSRLRVRLEGGHTYRLRRDSLEVSVTMPVLEALSCSRRAAVEDRGLRLRPTVQLRDERGQPPRGIDQGRRRRTRRQRGEHREAAGSARVARLHASGASTLNLDGFALTGEKLTMEADGGSTVEIRGSARAAVLHASGASHLKLADLALDAADVELGGASHASIRVKDLLNYDVSSASRLEYRGEPTINRPRSPARSSVSHRR